MAQAKVTDFFNTRKRSTVDFNASKRRKVQIAVQPDVELKTETPLSTTVTPPVSKRTRSRREDLKGNVQLTKTAASLTTSSCSTSEAKTVVPVKAKSAGKTRQKKTQPSKSKTVASDSVNIQAAFKKVELDLKKEQAPATDSATDSADVEIASLPTSAIDNHNSSLPSTPTKRIIKAGSEEKEVIAQKRVRNEKAVAKDILKDGTKTPEKGFDFSQHQQTSSKVRKKLVLKKTDSIDSREQEVFTFKGENIKSEVPSVQQIIVPNKESSRSGPASSSTKLDKGEKGVQVAPRSTTRAEPAEKLITSVKNPKDVRSELAKCGKLEALKAKLKQFNEDKVKAATKCQKQKKPKRLSDVAKELEKEIEQRKNEKPSTPAEPVAPAHERFSGLAAPVPATLTLPDSYRLLQEMFHSVDTVVSMLHKRSELCTFSKLKEAVQSIIHRAFEERNLGQITAVFPTAYILRQEKGLPSFGKKINGYQLTIEADLNTTGTVLSALSSDLKADSPDYQNIEKTRNCSTGSATVDKTKAVFTFAKVLERKLIFHRNLVEIVKKHHKEFLAGLQRPLSIPDHKLSRWHPKFKLEEVPDVVAAPIPQPPDVKIILTANEALNTAKSTFDPKIQAAMEKVAIMRSPPGDKGTSTAGRRNSLAGASPTSSAPSPATGGNGALKGVSQSLLERIRAKEAHLQEAAMLRTPEQEKRLERMGRLPEVVRILRAFCVTQKKPAVRVEDAIQKLSDSYRTSLGPVECELHIKLLCELVPEWLTMVSVQRGRFLKLDKNKDMAAVTDKLSKLLKASR